MKTPMATMLTENEILIQIEKAVEESLGLLKPVQESWQPTDFLPDFTKPDWKENVQELREKAGELNDELLVILVGNIVTEEALPSYQTWLNRPKGLQDKTGTSMNPWAQWTRGWTAEENRHGDLLNRYLYLSGRVNMRSLETTTHHLIKNGFDLKTGADPFKSIVYASFQERATKISHMNTAKLADKCGDMTLSKICNVIAGDEARHEEAYKRFFKNVLQLNPSLGILAFFDIMKTKISMPARLMSDGTDCDLFSQFAIVAQRTSVYTLRHYAEIVDHLMDYWEVASMTGLSPEAAEAQEYLGGLSEHYLSKAERVEEAISEFPPAKFEWLFGRKV